jgi:hypothetical protein
MGGRQAGQSPAEEGRGFLEFSRLRDDTRDPADLDETGQELGACQNSRDAVHDHTICKRHMLLNPGELDNLVLTVLKPWAFRVYGNSVYVGKENVRFLRAWLQQQNVFAEVLQTTSYRGVVY